MKKLYKEPIMDIEKLFVKDMTNNEEEDDNEIFTNSGVFDGWDDDE